MGVTLAVDTQVPPSWTRASPFPEGTRTAGPWAGPLVPALGSAWADGPLGGWPAAAPARRAGWPTPPLVACRWGPRAWGANCGVLEYGRTRPGRVESLPAKEIRRLCRRDGVTGPVGWPVGPKAADPHSPCRPGPRRR